MRVVPGSSGPRRRMATGCAAGQCAREVGMVQRIICEIRYTTNRRCTIPYQASPSTATDPIPGSFGSRPSPHPPGWRVWRDGNDSVANRPMTDGHPPCPSCGDRDRTRETRVRARQTGAGRQLWRGARASSAGRRCSPGSPSAGDRGEPGTPTTRSGRSRRFRRRCVDCGSRRAKSWLGGTRGLLR